MTYVRALDRDSYIRWALRACAELDARREEINALNVFPVPDSDTGSNMAFTMRAAVESMRATLEENPDCDVAEAAQALAVGAVRGARGNSGVVLSQILASLATAAHDGEIDGAAIVHALVRAEHMVTQAITEPVEGTVITVIRATARHVAALSDTSVMTVAKQALSAARTALNKTPSQLEVLRDAGVVDAGGQGFVVLLDTLVEELTHPGEGWEISTPAAASSDSADGEVVEHLVVEDPEPALFDLPGYVPRPLPHGSVQAVKGSDDHGTTANPHLEVMCFISLHEGTDLDQVRQLLQEHGDSVVIAPLDESHATVHVHTFDAGTLVEGLIRCGEITDLRFELLPEDPHTRPKPRAVIAIVPAGRLADLYQAAGAIVVHPISPSDPVLNYSADPQPTDTVSALVAAARSAGAKEIILLPNGLLSKQQLVSAELTSHASEKNLTILPTARLVSGIAALAVHDPNQPIAVDAYAMAEAAGAMTTAVVTRAYQAGFSDAGEILPGDLVSSSGGATITITRDLSTAIRRTCDMLLDRGGEMVTVLATAEAHAAIDIDQLDQHLAARGVDLTIYPADGMDHPVEIGVE